MEEAQRDKGETDLKKARVEGLANRARAEAKQYKKSC